MMMTISTPTPCLRAAMRMAMLTVIVMMTCAAALAQSTAAPASPPARPAAASYRIAGTLVDAVTGAAVAGARVMIAPVTNRDQARAVVAGDDGRFAFNTLAPGKYQLSAEHRGYPPQGFDEHEGFSTAIAVGEGLPPADDLNFRLRGESSISGRISEDSGEPVQQAQVMLFRRSLADGTAAPRMMRQGNSDDQGQYHFSHLPPGKYWLAVSARPWYARHPRANQNFASVGGFGSANPQPAPAPPANDSGASPLDVAYPLTFYPGVTEAEQAAEIDVPAGQRTTADLMLHAVPAVRLRVTSDAVDGRQPSGIASIRQHGFAGQGIRVSGYQSYYKSAGELEVTGLAPGRYEVQLFTPAADGVSPTSARREVDVGPGGGELDARTASAGARVSGTIAVEAGAAPQQSLQVRLRNVASDEAFMSPPAVNGEFALSDTLAPGVYELFTSAVGFFLKSLSATGARASGRRITIADSSPVKLALVLGHGVGTVEGVALRDGKPAAGVLVLLVPQNGAGGAAADMDVVRRDQSDSDGTFTLASVLPGAYVLLALENGWELEWNNPAVLATLRPRGQPLRVEPSGKYNLKLNVQ